MIEYMERILERVTSIKFYQSSKNNLYYAEVHNGSDFFYESSSTIEDLVIKVAELLEP